MAQEKWDSLPVCFSEQTTKLSKRALICLQLIFSWEIDFLVCYKTTENTIQLQCKNNSIECIDNQINQH
jgi:hypothetical protein